MDEELLASYLDDHLAGATAAIGIAQRLEEDTGIQPEMRNLKQQIESDRDALQTIRSRIDVGEGVVKRTIGFVGAFVEQIREHSPSSSPSTMEDLEALAIGIWGKRLLWGTMKRVSSHDSRFGDLDLDRLARRAEEQEKHILRLWVDAAESELGLEGSDR